MRRLFQGRVAAITCRKEGRDSDELALDGYLGREHLLVAPRGGTRGFIDEVLERSGSSRHVSRTVPTFLGALHALRDTKLMLTASLRLYQSVAQALPLRMRELPMDVPPYTINQLWHPRMDDDPAHRWMRGVVKRASESLDTLGDQPAS